MQARHHLTRCSWSSSHMNQLLSLFISSLYHSLLPLKICENQPSSSKNYTTQNSHIIRRKSRPPQRPNPFFKGGKFMSTKFKAFLKDTAIRAVKTMAQTALSLFTIGQAVTDVSWASVISISLVSGLYSVLTSIVNYNIRLDSPDTPDTTE